MELPMAFIPVVHRPYPDELLTSWIYHLAEDNGLSMSVFEESYLNAENHKNCLLYPDGRQIFPSLYQNIHTENFGSMKDLYLQLTTFQFESMVLTANQQTRCVNYIFREKDALNTKISTAGNPTRICPTCFKEDIEKFGRPYLHRSHQLSGVCTCYKHGIILKQYTYKTYLDNQFNFDNYTEIESDISQKSLQAYTTYVQALFEAQIDTNSRRIKDIILSKMEDFGYEGSDDYVSFVEDFKKWEYADLSCIKDYCAFFRKTMKNDRSSTVKKIVPILMFLFPDVNDLIDQLRGGEPILEMYTCPVCSRNYCSTPQAEADGWGCPYCNQNVSEQDRFKHLVDAAGHGKYLVLDEFQSLKQKIRMYHTTCGKEFSTTPYSFLFNGTRCSCEKIMPFENVQQIVESNAGFKLLEFKTVAEPLIIYHEKCGQSFKCRYYEFLELPACRICDPMFANTYTFKKKMKDLVGDEYSLVGEYTGSQAKVKIRHNVCGDIQEYIPFSFLNGQRCKNCMCVIQYKDCQQMLEIYSKGKYIITEHTKKSYITIQNTVSKKTIRLSMQKTIQEILRPTPSPILPVDEKPAEVYDYPLSWDQRYSLLVQFKDEYGTATVFHKTIYNGYPLGEWCVVQRNNYKQNKLTSRQTAMLESLGFIWDPIEAQWTRKYDLCVRYLAENKKNRIIHSTIYEGERIGRWLSHQKDVCKAGNQSEEKKKKLEELGISWTLIGETHDKEWLQEYDLCTRYLSETGVKKILDATVFEGEKIGKWIARQRCNYKNGKLSEDKQQKLLQLYPDIFS